MHHPSASPSSNAPASPSAARPRHRGGGGGGLRCGSGGGGARGPSSGDARGEGAGARPAAAGAAPLCRRGRRGGRWAPLPRRQRGVDGRGGSRQRILPSVAPQRPLASLLPSRGGQRGQRRRQLAHPLPWFDDGGAEHVERWAPPHARGDAAAAGAAHGDARDLPGDDAARRRLLRAPPGTLWGPAAPPALPPAAACARRRRRCGGLRCSRRFVAWGHGSF